MHADINVRFTVSFDENKDLTLAAVAEAVTDQQIESTILEGVIESLDESLVEAYCGEKYAQGNGTNRFQRAGTTTRQAVTTAGEHEFTLHHVEDTDPAHDDPTYFRPLDDVIDFHGQKIYQEGVSIQAVERATTGSYRDAVADGDGLTPVPSVSTVNRRAKAYGSKLKGFLEDRLAGTEAETVHADGTKCLSQDDDRSYEEISVTLGQVTERDDSETTLLDVSVNADWEDTATRLEDTDAIADDGVLVSDAEEPLVDAFVGDKRDHQLDLVHFVRTTGYYLWKDGQFPLEERNAYVEELEGDVFHLKNSVELHGPNAEYDAIADRIASTRDRLDRLGWQLDRRENPETASYIHKWVSSVVTFAEKAIDDVEVPWTSNVVERAMGEIAKRCKNQWMRWTQQGLESLLRLRLTSYANPDHYEQFVDELIGRSTKTAMTCEVSVGTTRGEF